MLRFSDGVEIDTSGEYRVIHLSDGYYLVGHGVCSPVDSFEDGKALMNRLKAIGSGIAKAAARAKAAE